MPASASDFAPDPVFVFDDSRRLTGPNFFFPGTAVVLTARCASGATAAVHAVAHQAWKDKVRTMAWSLNWPDPQPVAWLPGTDACDAVQLAFVAPVDTLFTATEVNEWAWETSAVAAGLLGADVMRLHPLDVMAWADLVAQFAAKAAAEASRPLQRLRQAAKPKGLPWLEDDDTASIGAGRGSISYPRNCVPLAIDVPWPRLHAIPTALITGSNGKTTTTRLLAAMVRAAGLTPGWSSTEGVWVGRTLVDSGDYAGPAGARAVLRHRDVDIAVLETARGGILRRGLAVTQATVALVTNVSADHLGEYGLQSEADIAQAKLVVARALQGGGTLVLNADDVTLMHTASLTPYVDAVPLALFSRHNDLPALTALRQRGGSTCSLVQGHLHLWQAGVSHDLGAAADMPLALNGAAPHNIANAMAAALVGVHLGLPITAMQHALHHFGSNPSDNPGRLERWQHRGAAVLIDYAHNPDGLLQLLQTARALQPHRLGLLLGQAGNRDNQAIQALAEVAAAGAGLAPELIVIKELPAMLRGRAEGEVSQLLFQGLLKAGVTPSRVAQVPDELAAAQLLLAWAQVGDVVVLPVHTAAVRERLAVHFGG